MFKVMIEQNDDIFQCNPASFWEQIPGHQVTEGILVENQETKDVVAVPLAEVEGATESEIIAKVNRFYNRYNLFKKHLDPEKVKQMIFWLREESNLLHLVALQVSSRLIKLYEHLIKVRLKTSKNLFDPEIPPVTVITDKEGEVDRVSLNLNEADLEEIVEHLVRDFASIFEISNNWEFYAQKISIEIPLSAWDKMEREIGKETLDYWDYDTRAKTWNRYVQENQEWCEAQLSAKVKEFSINLASIFIDELKLPHLTFRDLNRILGFKEYEVEESIPVTESRLTDDTVAVPTFAAFASAINAQLRKDLWQENASGIAYFQHQARSNQNNYIEHYITSPGDISILPWNQAEQIIDKFGFNTVKLHLIFAAHTMAQAVPWEGKFSLKASDIVKYLGWDKRTDLPIHEKLNEIAKAAFILDCLLVKSVWIEGKNKKGGINASTPTGRMWNLVVAPKGQLNLEGKVEKPEEVYITVQPGLIFQSFLNKAGSRLKEALYQFGYLAQDILRIDPYHDELALRLAIHLTMDSRIHFTGTYRVETLLKALLSHSVIDAAHSDKRKAYDLKQRWDNALKLLMQLRWQIQFDESYPEWLQPGREVPRPEGSRKIKIIEWLLQAKLTIQPPKPIPELLSAKVEPKPKPEKLRIGAGTMLTGSQIRKAREAKGWSQRKLAGWLGVSDVLIGYWEKGKRTPSRDMDLKLREVLQIAE